MTSDFGSECYIITLSPPSKKRLASHKALLITVHWGAMLRGLSTLTTKDGRRVCIDSVLARLNHSQTDSFKSALLGISRISVMFDGPQ